MKYSKQKLSVHLIHTRIAVQGSIVGALTGMLLYQFYQDTMKRSENKKMCSTEVCALKVTNNCISYKT